MKAKIRFSGIFLALVALLFTQCALAQAQQETAQEASAPEATTQTSDGEVLISVDFKDADIRQVLRVISLKSGVDIVASPDIAGLVTIKLTNVPWEQALDIILRTYGFTYDRKGNVIRVMTQSAIEQESLSTEVFPLNYSTAKEVSDVLKEMLSDRGRIKFDARTNTVIVTDLPSNVFRIQQVISRLDQRTPQVMIATKIVETKLENDENLGIEWSSSFDLTQSASVYPSSFPFLADSSFGEMGKYFISPPVGRVDGPDDVTDGTEVGIGTLTGPGFAWTLNLLKQRSNTNILSNPSLAVLNNQEAKIHIGEEFPVPKFQIDPDTGNTTVSGYETKSIGTVLTVTPHVNQSKEIVIDLKPEIISLGDNAEFDTGSGQSVSLPRFTTQTAKTQVRVNDGETVAIGGLIKEIEIKTESKVPILGDIPIIGLLFKNNRKYGGSENPTLKQDLLIFLTVTLAKDEPKQAAAK